MPPYPTLPTPPLQVEDGKSSTSLHPHAPLTPHPPTPPPPPPLQVEDGKVYCLPDMYQVADRSLGDIQYVLSPTFTG